MKQMVLVAVLAIGVLAQDRLSPTHRRIYKTGDGKEVSVFVREEAEVDGKKCLVLVHEGLEGDLGMMAVENTKDGLLVRRFERKISEPFYWVKWPLKEGLKWEAQIEAGRYQKEKLKVAFEVTGLEEVKTPAGAFKAWKVEFAIGEASGAYWYEPNLGEVKRWVKTKGKELSFELAHLRDWGDPRANERKAFGSLKQICSIQVTFKTLDSDGNQLNDYWVGDIAGLHRIASDGDENNVGIQLIEAGVAFADAAPIKAPADLKYSKLIKFPDRPEPKSGYYFTVIASYESGPGDKVKYDSGNGRNVDRFGVAAIPAEYPRSGKLTFIVNEGGTLFKKDTGGKVPEYFPLDPIKEGWQKAD